MNLKQENHGRHSAHHFVAMGFTSCYTSPQSTGNCEQVCGVIWALVARRGWHFLKKWFNEILLGGLRELKNRFSLFSIWTPPPKKKNKTNSATWRKNSYLALAFAMIIMGHNIQSPGTLVHRREDIPCNVSPTPTGNSRPKVLLKWLRAYILHILARKFP